MAWVNGNDISYWQGDVDFEVMKSAGSRFVYIRKSIGYYGDLRFWEYFEGSKQADLPMSVYHYFYPGFSVERQFQKFTEGISPSDLDFPPVLDVEHRYTGITKSRAISDTLAMLYLLRDWWTGPKHPIIYTAKFVWEELYSSKPGWLHDWDLFVANYTNEDWPQFVPRGWVETSDGVDIPVEDQFELWQWEADGNQRGAEFGVSSDDIDMDRMQPDYYNLFLGEQPDDPQPEPIVFEIDIPANVDRIIINRV